MSDVAAKFAETVEGSHDWIRGRIQNALYELEGGIGGTYYWLRDVFADTAIAEDESTRKLYEFPYSIADGVATLGEPTEVKLEYVTKRREAAQKSARHAGIELGGPFVRKDEEERVAYAAVLVPGEVDLNGEPPLSVEDVRKYAHGYMENFRHMDTEHNFEVGVAVPVESWLTESVIKTKTLTGEDVELPAGTWMLGSKVTEEHWPDVKSGKYAGYSITGIPRAALEGNSAEKTVDALALKLNLCDLEDPVIGIVSMVGKPAVGKAKWIALKAQQQDEPPAKRSFLEMIFGGPKANEVRKDIEPLGDKEDGEDMELKDLVAAMKESNRELLKEAGVLKEAPSDTDRMIEAIQGLGEKIDSLSVSDEDDGDDDPFVEMDEEDEFVEKATDLKAQISEIQKKLKTATGPQKEALKKKLKKLQGKLTAQQPKDKSGGTAKKSTEGMTVEEMLERIEELEDFEARATKAFEKTGVQPKALDETDEAEEKPAQTRNSNRDMYGRAIRGPKNK